MENILLHGWAAFWFITIGFAGPFLIWFSLSYASARAVSSIWSRKNNAIERRWLIGVSLVAAAVLTWIYPEILIALVLLTLLIAFKAGIWGVWIGLLVLAALTAWLGSLRNAAVTPAES